MDLTVGLKRGLAMGQEGNLIDSVRLLLAVACRAITLLQCARCTSSSLHARKSCLSCLILTLGLFVFSYQVAAAENPGPATEAANQSVHQSADQSAQKSDRESSPESKQDSESAPDLGQESASEKGSKDTSKVVSLSSSQKLALGLKVVTVEKHSVKSSLTSPGKIEFIPSLQFALHAPLAGTISKIFVQPGQIVHVGQVLALLQSPDLNRLAAETLQSKAQVTSEIAQSRVLLEDEISESKAKKAFAEANFQRDSMLFAHGLASQEEMQLAKSDLEVAEARNKAALAKKDVTLKALQEKYAVTMEPLDKRLQLLGVNAKDVSAMLANRNAISLVPIRSTGDGLVTEIKATVGETIDPTVLLFTVASISRVWATAFAYEEDVSSLHIGERVWVKVAAIPDHTFEGKLTFVGSQVDSQSRTLPVRAEINNPRFDLKPDMYATVEIEVDHALERIIVPRDSVITHGGSSLVFVEREGGYLPTDVQLGRPFGNRVEIKSGLVVGDRIVEKGSFPLLAEWIKKQQGEEAFAHASGDGEAESGEEKKSESPNASDKAGGNGLIGGQSLIFGIVIAAFLAGSLVTALVLRARKPLS